MALSIYHQKYTELSDAELQKRAEVKEAELKDIFGAVSFVTDNNPVRIAIMGCGDKRFIHFHREIFARLLGKEIDLTTLDITIDHLAGELGVLQHDCTMPLPNGPYDITYAHVLLKFIQTDKQWDLISNSLNVLREGGIAIHVFDSDDYDTAEPAEIGLFKVPLEQWESKLSDLHFNYTEVPVKYGLAVIIHKK